MSRLPIVSESEKYAILLLLGLLGRETVKFGLTNVVFELSPPHSPTQMQTAIKSVTDKYSLRHKVINGSGQRAVHLTPGTTLHDLLYGCSYELLFIAQAAHKRHIIDETEFSHIKTAIGNHLTRVGVEERFVALYMSRHDETHSD